MTFHVGALACKTFRQGNIVRIHAGDKGGPRQGEALVQGGYQAPVFPLHQPDAAILAYPVITSGQYTHGDSMLALLGSEPGADELEYMSLEKHVSADTPPCFLWQTVTDASVPVENSYLFAQVCREQGVPFAHHVFSDGVHGLSVATEQWLERDFGEPYTLEQIRLLAEAVSAGKTPYPPEKGREILADFGLDGRKKEKWDPEQKEEIRKTLKTVGIWPELAKDWLDQIWKQDQ